MWNIWTTAHSQGKQGGITIFSPVINIGKSRPGTDDKVPMTLKADKHDILVALSRARVGRISSETCVLRLDGDLSGAIS